MRNRINHDFGENNSFIILQESYCMKLELLTRVIINKSDYGLIEYLPEIPCLRIVRTGFQLSSEIQEGCNAILTFLQQREPGSKISLLYDLEEGEPMLEEDLQWIAEEWKPQVVALGVKHVAVVPPQKEFGQLSVDVIREAMKSSQASTTDQYFPDNESALEWLQNVLSH
jgi:hypothetical protein